MPRFTLSLPSPSLTRKTFTALLGALIACLIAVGAAVGYTWSARKGMVQLASIATERLELYASALQAEIARYAYLTSLIAINADVVALLDDPGNAVLQERADRTLSRMNVRAGSTLMFITAGDGRLLATSEASMSAPTTAAAVLSTRGAEPVDDDAVDYFAANPLDGTTDYFFVQVVHRDDRRRARIVVKVSLTPLEATWIDLGLRTHSERLLVVDENNVVVMSSVPGWKYRALDAVNPTRVRASGRYGQAALAPLDLVRHERVDASSTLVRVADAAKPDATLRLAQEREIVPLAVRLMALSDPSEVWRNSRDAAWGGGAGGAALGMLLLYVLQRRRAMRQVFRARNELQRAHDQLERQVDERTSELRTTNDELKRQIAHRLQVEDELMQAGKLAVLGQMSAGISHEINQPLTALRALARNTIRLLADGRTAAVSDNLQTIDAMVERMGRIVTQLKSFARKGGTLVDAVNLSAAVYEALLLLEHRVRTERVAVSVSVPDQIRVRADITRLGQVLVNLVGNALDAMAQSPVRELRIGAELRDGRVTVTIADSGHGMDAAAIERLPEPFFTTKPPGQGLGLGLVISSKIVREFGGSLRASRAEVGMRFEFDLEGIEDTHV